MASIDAAYELVQSEPEDRLDYLSKSLQIINVLNGGAMFLNEVATSPYVDDYTDEDFRYIHEAFCDAAFPLIQMIEHFAEKMEREAEKNSLAV